jgi:NADH-quinone oxidoreductase B subunit
MSAVDLPPPSIGPLSRLAPKPVKFVLNWGRRYSLWVFNFGLACCAIEFIATSMSRHDFIRLGVIPFAPGPRQADLMVVSGTVSDKMAPAVRRLYEQMPEPKYVISFGACSNCGGPYWDSYCVTKGVDQIVPVDVYVPGCPPRPEALLHGIVRLQEKIAGESLGDRYGNGGEPVTPAPPPRPFSATVLRRPLVAPPVPPDDIPTLGLTPLPDEPHERETHERETHERETHERETREGEARERGRGPEVEREPEETKITGEHEEYGESPGGPTHLTQPVAPVDEPDAPVPSAAPDDVTIPVEHIPEESPQTSEAPQADVADETGETGDTGEPGESEEEAAPAAGRAAPRRRSRSRSRGQDHDPSIIPGLTDDHDAGDDDHGRFGR